MFVGIISCPSLLTNESPQTYRLTVDICFLSRHLLSYFANFTCFLTLPISLVNYYTGIFYDIWTRLLTVFTWMLKNLKRKLCF